MPILEIQAVLFGAVINESEDQLPVVVVVLAAVIPAVGAVGENFFAVVAAGGVIDGPDAFDLLLQFLLRTAEPRTKRKDRSSKKPSKLVSP